MSALFEAILFQSETQAGFRFSKKTHEPFEPSAVYKCVKAAIMPSHDA